ncbi:hypothetical protein MKW98_004869 [Papaver atlanticum]|uniref:Uncharacterized protein n=1 Tax=Papaver atlanticum TaxID=357466 RepID=A0AAD4RWX8_9MAGN|nr:hypothetical protein MKW98_004869 [Papaver atlanticum]
MDPKDDKLVRKTTMVASVTAAYFLLTSDYGNQPNILDPIYEFFFGSYHIWKTYCQRTFIKF